MMKRILPILAALMLCLCLPLCASADMPDALYRIVLRTAEGDVPLGSAVVYGAADTLLTAEGCLREGTLFAIGADGEHAVSSWESIDATGMALLRLAEPSAAEPLPGASMEEYLHEEVYGVTAQGAFVSANAAPVQRSVSRTVENVTLSTMDGLLPGAVMLDESGALVAMTVSQQGEGQGLYSAVYEVDIAKAMAADATVFVPVTLSWDGGIIHLTWTDIDRTNGVYYLMIMAEENEFYTGMTVEADRRSASVVLSPGHTYYFLMQWVADGNGSSLVFDWDSMQTYTLPEGRFTQYGFEQSCALILADKGERVSGRKSSPALFTVDTLTSANTSRYLQLIYTHHTAEKVTLPMTVSLIAPDGQFYAEEMGCTFSPADAGKELITTVSVDELLESCVEFSAGGTLPAGEYALCWSLAGKQAGRYAFTVAESGIPVPTAAPSSATLVENLAVTQADGLITVDWSGCGVPDGKLVTVYIAFESNLYYSYSVADAADGQAIMYSVPGEKCAIWAVAADEADHILMPETPAQKVLLTIPAAQTIRLHDMHNLRCSVTVSADADAAEKGEYLPETPVTREALQRGEHLYFQTEDAYTVAEESSEHALMLVLYLPDGMSLMYAGGYTFSPELADSDLWLLDITELMEDYSAILDGDEWLAGEYTLVYYVAGQTVAQCTFILE